MVEKNGLRLLWDSFDNLEFLRASLLLEFLKNNQKTKVESLNYFESQLKDMLIKLLITEQKDSDLVSGVITATFIITTSNDLIEYFKSELAKDIKKGSNQIINFYNNLKQYNLPSQDETIPLFIEKETEFCEYPQLKDIKSKVPNVIDESSELRGNLKNFTTSFFTINIDKLLSQPSMTFEDLEGLELEEQLVNNILNKFNELKLKGNSEKLRIDFTDLFDKLMKFIQSTIRSNYLLVLDENLKTKYKTVCDNLKTYLISVEEVEIILKSFNQTILNKSNIIFTIHRNEISALNSKREIPIPSKLLLAVNICTSIDKECQQQTDNLLYKYLEENIISRFYEMWFNDISATFEKLKNENNEIFALSWLSDAFLSLQISNEYKIATLKSLNIDEEDMRNKYFPQTALLTGLLEPEKILTPKLKSSTISESTRELLPHFIPI